MDLLRRTVLKGAGASGVLAGLLAAGVLKPTLAYASDWNKAAFEAKELDAALNGKTVVSGQTAGSVSRNPVFGFKVKGAKAGDKVAVSWVDNKGDKRTDETTVA